MPIDEIKSKEIAEYASEMIAVLKSSDGLAIAAPQVGLSLRMMVMDIPLKAPNPRYAFSEDKNHEEFPLTIMINPSFESLSDEKQYGWESCLSFPGYKGKVERYKRIHCKWFDLNGGLQEKKLSGFNAKVFQHEYDHLEGIVYLSRINDISTFTHI